MSGETEINFYNITIISEKILDNVYASLNIHLQNHFVIVFQIILIYFILNDIVNNKTIF